MGIQEQIQQLQSSYNNSTNKDEAYKELLDKYKLAQERIKELEDQSKSSKIPTKDEVDAMSGMLDLINKLDESTIEKLSKFGDKK